MPEQSCTVEEIIDDEPKQTTSTIGTAEMNTDDMLFDVI